MLESLDRINIKNLILNDEAASSIITHIKRNGAASFILEALAHRTWDTLRYSIEVRLSQGEETITDNNLLAIKLSGIKEILVWKCPKDDEGKTGIDWEWFIGSDKLGWLRYAVQAKKLDPLRLRYDKLNHEVNGKRQIDILDGYANSVRAIPLYCLYNYVEKDSFTDYWHCTLNCDPSQLGCTVTPLEVIKQALSVRGARSFDYIHSNECTIPWRCLVRCQHITNAYKTTDKSLQTCFGTYQVYPQIPAEVRALFEVDHVSEPRYLPRFEFIPGRILIIRLNDIEERSENKPSEAPPLPEIRRF